MWARSSGGDRRWRRPALALLLLAACSGDDARAFVDLPRVSEALRARRSALAEGCSSGFPGFLEAAGQVIGALEGAAALEQSLSDYRRPGGGLDPRRLPEPGLFRLLLHRYGEVCRAPAADALARQLGELAQAEGGDLTTGLTEALSGTAVLGDRVHLVSPADNAQAVVLELSAPGERAGSPPLVWLTCLRCRAGSEVSGPRQIASTVAALRAVADSQVVLTHPVRLVICPDASRKPGNCGQGVIDPDEQVTAALALDGIQPLVAAWSAEVSWHLALPHQPPSAAWLALARRRPVKGTSRPVVWSAGASGSLDELPPEAWMELVDPAQTPAELLEQVEGVIAELSEAAEGARYEAELQGERVRVAALTEARPAWEITERQSSLWRLSALARALRVTDAPQGSLAAMLRAVQRFDGDPYGARLGLHYEDPLGGPLLVAPCSLSVEDGQVILGIRMYRPPGLDRRAFLARLLEARDRLRFATGRPLEVVEREVGDPSRVRPDSELVLLVQRALVELADEDEPPEPSGSPRPGLGVLLSDALSIRLPTRANRVNPAPSVTLIVELIWQLAVATEPEVRQASRWE